MTYNRQQNRKASNNLQTLYTLSKPRLTKRAPDAGDSGAIPSLFLRLSIFPVGRCPAARPSAGNANRWALARVPKQGYGEHENSK